MEPPRRVCENNKINVLKMDIESGSIDKNKNGELIIFKNVTCKVAINYSGRLLRRKNGNESKIIIRNACGALKPGRVTFILGPSGAGKTTLLHVLAGRRKTGVTGTVLGVGSEVVLVPQHAALIDTMTAQETLQFAAALKLPNLTQRERQYAIEHVAKRLGIQDVLKTRASQLSGGEVKRLTISCEMLTDPPVMLLDEPTSGLDSVSSVSVVRALRIIASSGRTVACVIHQPTSKVYSQGDDVILLAEGRTLYAGSINDAPEALTNASFMCPNYYNVADYLLEVASGEHQGNLNILENAAKNYTNEISSVDETMEINGNSKPIEIESLLQKPMTSSRSKDNYKSNTQKQLKALLWRCFIGARRDLHLTQIRVICHVLVALLLGAVYHGAGSDAARVHTNTACLFFFLLFLFFSNSMPTIHTFPVEASVVLQQHLNKWYSLPAYCASKIIADLPIQLLCATLFVIPAWWLTSQPWDNHRVLLAWIICVLVTILAQNFGLVIGAACGVQLGLFVVPAANIPMLMFSEFFIPYKEMATWLQPVATISYFRYSFDAFMQIAYGFNRPKLPCSLPFCFFRYPQRYLDELGLNTNIVTDILVLLVWILVLQLSLYLVLRARVWFACR